ncbi:MAG: hypothetical protein OXH56_00285 [Gemmatimonadetes bacterium]|nr:hypothetical protein [Gemmatimonadota bacterium]
MPVTGGRRLQRSLRRALTAIGVDEIEIGFFSTAKYPDGTPVAAVAAKNEFGTRTRDGKTLVPERPFFRQALGIAKERVFEHLKDNVEGETLVVGDALGDEIGEIVQQAIQERIVELREPPNAPSTLARKKPKTNPLIDTGTMRTAVTYRTVKL